MRLSHCAFLIASISACTVKMVPPPQTPAQQLPSLPVEPPPPVQDQGQVALEAVGGPARVEVILATEQWSGTYVAGSSVRTAPVCVTPCVANLPYGSHELRFQSLKDPSLMSTDVVTVATKPSVFRYQIGRTETHIGKSLGGIMLFSFGIVGAATGLSLAAADIGGGPMIGVGLLGLGVSVVGGLLWNAGRTEVQPGAGTQWTPVDGIIHANQ